VDRPLHAHTDVKVRFDDAIELLTTAPERLLQDATDARSAHDEEILAALRTRVGGLDISRDVVIEVGTPRPVEALRTILPLRWRAAAADGLFPTVDGQLEIAALSMYPPRVQLTLSGTYDPPFGAAGDIIDRVLVHHLAENVVQDFVAEVAARLENVAATTALTSNVQAG
jgi:hypothetical protein